MRFSFFGDFRREGIRMVLRGGGQGKGGGGGIGDWGSGTGVIGKID
jgi:hypothetical protein